MVATDKIIVANLDFEDVKRDIIDNFQSRSEFTDYEFTGSSLNLLIDILSYNTHYYSLASNFLLNESFLDSAVLRNSVISRAKSLNYKPRSASAASTTVTLSFTKQSADDILVVVPAGSKFTAASSNQTKTFNTVQDYVMQFNTNDAIGTVKTLDVKVFEGRFTAERFVQTEDATNFTSFELSDGNCDDTTLTVSVNGTKYFKVLPEDQTLFELNSSSISYFLEESRNNRPVVIFGNGIVGKPLKNGDEIIISYLSTSGAEGNGISRFTASIPGRLDGTIVKVSGPTSGGGVKESIQSIKDNAPKWFQAQYRAVTTNDYEAVLKNKYADIQAISVWGGEDVGYPGKVFICIKPKSADKLTESVKQILKNEIVKNQNVVTVRPDFVDPVVLRLKLDTVVIYDETKLATNRSLLEAKISTMHQFFNNNYVGDFLQSFRESNFSREVKNLDNSVVSSNTRVTITTDVLVSNYYLTKYSYNFNNKLYHPQDGFFAERGGIFSSSLFLRRGAKYYSAFDEDGYGNIRLYDFVNDTKVYINRKAGRIDYDEGTVEFLYEFFPTGTKFTITVIPESVDVIAERETILEIDSGASKVTALEVNDTSIIKNLNLTRSV